MAKLRMLLWIMIVVISTSVIVLVSDLSTAQNASGPRPLKPRSAVVRSIFGRADLLLTGDVYTEMELRRQGMSDKEINILREEIRQQLHSSRLSSTEYTVNQASSQRSVSCRKGQPALAIFDTLPGAVYSAWYANTGVPDMRVAFCPLDAVGCAYFHNIWVSESSRAIRHEVDASSVLIHSAWCSTNY